MFWYHLITEYLKQENFLFPEKYYPCIGENVGNIESFVAETTRSLSNVLSLSWLIRKKQQQQLDWLAAPMWRLYPGHAISGYIIWVLWELILLTRGFPSSFPVSSIWLTNQHRCLMDKAPQTRWTVKSCCRGDRVTNWKESGSLITLWNLPFNCGLPSSRLLKLNVEEIPKFCLV